MTTATDITATIITPSNDELFGSDWNWADEATKAWGLAAREAGLKVNIVSYEVPDLNHDAAVVEVDGTEYVLTVVTGDEVHAVER